MEQKEREAEELRSKLLDDVYAGAFSGLPAMFSDESRIKNASYEELVKIAKEYGY